MSFRSIAVVALLAPAIAGCGSAESEESTKTVEMKLTTAGCDPTRLELATGATTFKVTNSGADKVTEFYVMSGSKVEGEVEGVTPGKTKDLTLNLQPGSYGLKCPGGITASDGVLIVSGTTTTVAADTAGATANYRAFVQQQADELVVRTKAFTDAVIAGDVAKAKLLYPASRMPYERIEPVAESFGDLDPAIDARADEVTVDELTGFHRIENALWTNNTTTNMKPVAEKLLADVTTLRDKVRTLDIDAAKIANGANELLGEVSQSKITGEEERYSHTDLWDFVANVEGSKAAIAAVRPLLDKKDPELGRTIDARFAAVEAALAPYRRGEGFVLYNELTNDDTRKLSQAIDALAEPISEVSAKVVG